MEKFPKLIVQDSVCSRRTNNRVQDKEIMVVKYSNTVGHFLQQRKKIDENIIAKIRNSIKTTRTNSPTELVGTSLLPAFGDTFFEN